MNTYNNEPYYYESARELGITVAEYLRGVDENYVIIEDGEPLIWSDNGHPVIYGGIADAEADKQDGTIITERKYIEDYLPNGMQYPMFHVIFETLDESGDNVTEWTSLYQSEDKEDALSYAKKWIADGELYFGEQLTVQEVTFHGYEGDFEGAELLWFYTYEMQCEKQNDSKTVYLVSYERVHDCVAMERGHKVFAKEGDALSYYEETTANARAKYANEGWATEEDKEARCFDTWSEKDGWACEHYACYLSRVSMQ